ncbi:MAG: glutathione S- transferase, nitrogen catabolite repression regulator [Chrysothrix sp. TS-e1954]|nr:MAG: glutathione S- transferase, nitrogen catabolite repression regulator [Chrysothrix sp. TS-e1954]
MSKPIKLYSHAGGPNPPKVAIILEELGVPYETELLEFPDMKKEPYTSLNPNGRVPTIEDPNTGMTVWESSAIYDYLLEYYDKSNKLQYTSGREKYQQKSWMAMQISGQGPYYGQRAWFTMYHPEKNIQSAIDRYGGEVKRVIGVLDSHLKKTGKPYLVGDKCTYADLAFVPWHWTLIFPPQFMGADFAKEWEKEFPDAWAWHQRLHSRPAVTKVFDERLKVIMAQKH